MPSRPRSDPAGIRYTDDPPLEAPVLREQGIKSAFIARLQELKYDYRLDITSRRRSCSRMESSSRHDFISHWEISVACGMGRSFDVLLPAA